MKNSIFSRILGVFAVIFLLSLSTVSAYSYDWNYSPYGSSNDNYYKETHTLKSRDVDYDYSRDGYAKRTTTTNKKIVIEKYDYPQYSNSRYSYGSSCDRYYYENDCYGYAPSNWRNAPVYKYGNYGDDSYTKPYYYDPAQSYDWHSGFYNWNY